MTNIVEWRSDIDLKRKPVRFNLTGFYNVRVKDEEC